MGPKIALSLVWVWSALCLLAPLPARGLGQATFWIMVVVHAVECAVMLPRLRSAPGPLSHHLVQTFLFGLFHWRKLPSVGEAGGA